MAMAYGIASGLGPVAGMYGAIIVGFCASVFGGTQARIAYSSAAMTVGMMIVLTQHATSLSEAFTIVMLAGVIQIALGLLRVGRFINYTPYSMIAGFTSGIGLMIHNHPDVAVHGGASRAWRSAWHHPRVAGRGGRHEFARRHRGSGEPGGLRVLAAPAGTVRTRDRWQP